MNFYKHHIGDYDADTAHLSWIEDAAYRRLISLYYRREAPIPLEVAQACRLIRASSKQEREAVEAVLNEFFERTEEGWRSKRCDEELASAEEQGGEREAKLENERERQRRHREERKKLFEQLRQRDIVPAWDTKTEALRGMLNAQHVTPLVTQSARDESQPVTPPVTRTATANQTPDSRLQKNTPQPPKGEGRFAEFWSSWPSTERKQDRKKCLAKWQRNGWDSIADEVIAHVIAMKATRKWLDGYEPAPLTYLNGERWLDGVEVSAAANDIFAGAH